MGAFFSALGLILVTMVGYASGAVLTAGKKDPTPRIVDILLIIGLWTGGFLSRGLLGRWWALLVWFVAAMIISYIVIGLRKSQLFDAPSEHFAQLNSAWSMPKQLWERWKVFGARLGHFQSRMLMAFFYFVIVSWVGIPVRLVSDFLGMKRPPVNSAWSEKLADDATVEAARNQF